MRCVLLGLYTSLFTANKFVKLPVKQLKSILVDFCTIEALPEDKVRLLTDTEAMETPVKSAHVPRRRDGDNRIVREVEDIITPVQYLDEN